MVGRDAVGNGGARVRGVKGWMSKSKVGAIHILASFLPLEQGRRRAYQEPQLEAAMRAIRSHYLDSG